MKDLRTWARELAAAFWRGELEVNPRVPGRAPGTGEQSPVPTDFAWRGRARRARPGG